MIFESHAHYDDERFDEDRAEVIEALKVAGIGKVINIGANMASSFSSVELSKQHEFMYAAIGVHPHDVISMTEGDLETLIALAANKKVVAIGEIGLDYFYEHSPKEVQKLWFREQINLAKALKLPIVVHSRDATKDTLDIIIETKAAKLGGVIHCFASSKETAKTYTDMGFYLGVGGVVTYKNAKVLKEVVEAIPLAHLLLETDCPYLSPVPNRGKRNDSRNIPYIAQAIADIKGIGVEEVIQVTYDNAMNLFFGSKQ